MHTTISPSAPVLYLHIGLDKTGSTAIQNLLVCNSKALAARSYTYIQTGRENSHNHYTLFHATRDKNFGLWEKVGKELRCSSATGIVSFEGLYHLTPTEWLQVKKALKGIDIRVLLYLRRQSDMVRSGIAQRIKQGLVHLPLREYTAEKLMAIAHDYEVLANQLCSVFGRSQLTLRRYEHCRWPEENLFLDFLQAIGLQISGTELDNLWCLPQRDPNPTLNVESIYLLDMLDGLGIEAVKRRQVVRLLLAQMDDDRSTFVSNLLARRIDNTYIHSNRQLAQDWFNEQSLFQEHSLFVYRAPRSQLVARYFALIRRWQACFSLTVWGGARYAPGKLIAQGKMLLKFGRLRKDSLMLTYRPSKLNFLLRDAGEARFFLIEGRWLGESGHIKIMINDEHAGIFAGDRIIVPASEACLRNFSGFVELTLSLLRSSTHDIRSGFILTRLSLIAEKNLQLGAR